MNVRPITVAANRAVPTRREDISARVRMDSSCLILPIAEVRKFGTYGALNFATWGCEWRHVGWLFQGWGGVA